MMKQIDKQKPVLVTGGTGYMASWIIKQLLDLGHEVRTTVRNLSARDKYAHLTRLSVKSKGVLEVFEADLLEPGSFEAAMSGCELVIHTASPFFISGIKDAQKQLIEPAVEGTRNVLGAVDKIKTVKRVVLTSSVVAIYGDAADMLTAENGIFTEQNWNTTSSRKHQPYAYSKTQAEKLAWEMAGKQNRWDLVVINPGLIIGPSLSTRTDSTSIDLMLQLVNGKFKTGVPAGTLGLVDVRDVARAHLQAGFLPGASGRHICVGSEHSMLDVANEIRKLYPRLPLPKGLVPTGLFWLIAPFVGFTRKYVKLNVGLDVKFDNSYIKNDLQMSFIPFEKTIFDHLAQLVDDGLLIVK
jgi:nucleoside-diphosphate-sugar epimerase